MLLRGHQIKKVLLTLKILIYLYPLLKKVCLFLISFHLANICYMREIIIVLDIKMEKLFWRKLWRHSLLI